MTTELTTKTTGELVLSERAQAYIKRSKAPSTLRAYNAAWREFVAFASDRHAPSLPATPETVIEYISSLASAGAKVATVELKLAAIAWAHRANEHPDPTTVESVRATMAGIRRELGTAPTKKAAATLTELQLMLDTLDLDTLKGIRDRALLLVGYAGAFRRSELVALDVDDLSIGADGLVVTVRRSKTDQVGAGQYKHFLRFDELCPVAALEAWLDAAAIASGPVFRPVDRWGNLGDSRLTSQSVAHIVKASARAAGLDWRRYSGHSLRSGFVTTALNNEAAETDVMAQTQHTSADTMRGYWRKRGIGAKRAVRAAFGQGDKLP